MDKPNNPKLIIFDLDGVLVNSIGSWYSVFNTALREHHEKAVSMDEFKKKVWGVPANHVFAQYFKGKAAQDEILAMYNTHFTKALTKTFIFPEAKPVLEQLKQHQLKTAVASNSHSRIVNLLLEHAELKQYFDLVLSADMFSKGKPSPEMLLGALEQCGVGKEEAVFVGDTFNDVAAGKAAGIYTVGSGIDADVRIEKLDELLGILGIK